MDVQCIHAVLCAVHTVVAILLFAQQLMPEEEEPMVFVVKV